jgi:hypothetical protein
MFMNEEAEENERLDREEKVFLCFSFFLYFLRNLPVNEMEGKSVAR